jgi:hypothetical protein
VHIEADFHLILAEVVCGRNYGVSFENCPWASSLGLSPGNRSILRGSRCGALVFYTVEGGGLLYEISQFHVGPNTAFTPVEVANSL